jgi:hypothetical protein
MQDETRPRLTPGPDAAADEYVLAAVVQRLLQVPNSYRKFEVGARQAARLHRVGPDLLSRLLDLGMPHREGVLLDVMDLENVGLALRLATPRWTAMRSWRRCLQQCPRSGSVAHRLTIQVRCPQPQCHDCDVALHPLVMTAAQPQTVRRTRDGFCLDLTATAVDHHFEGPFAALVDAVRDLHFQLLPAQLAADLDFVARTGLADCVSATEMLLRAGREHGIRLRPAVGLLLTTPYPTWHRWIEVDTGGTWLAADPFLLGVFARWGIVDPGLWPVNRSPQGVLWRCHTDAFPMVVHGDSAVWARLTLEQRPEPAARPVGMN